MAYVEHLTRRKGGDIEARVCRVATGPRGLLSSVWEGQGRRHVRAVEGTRLELAWESLTNCGAGIRVAHFIGASLESQNLVHRKTPYRTRGPGTTALSRGARLSKEKGRNVRAAGSKVIRSCGRGRALVSLSCMGGTQKERAHGRLHYSAFKKGRGGGPRGANGGLVVLSRLSGHVMRMARGKIRGRA